MRRGWYFAASLLLSSCASVGNGTITLLPPPPPPPPHQAPMTEALQALTSEWRPLNAAGQAERYRLTIWGPAFAYGAGCNVAMGQLHDLGHGHFGIEGNAALSPRCRAPTRPAPFDSVKVRIVLLSPEAIRVESGASIFLFNKVDVTATLPSDDFLRGEWLLADERGAALRGDALTRITFDDRGYTVTGKTCSFNTNGWSSDREWTVRVGGSQSVQTRKCTPHSLGDRIAKAGNSVRLIAEPVETRLRVKVGSRTARLVPAARFPELAAHAAVVAPHPWAQRLAAVGRATFVGPPLFSFALRAAGLSSEDGPMQSGSFDQRRQGFAGLSAAQYARAQQQGLLPAGEARLANLRQHFASAPIVVRAILEGIPPVDRGDGLSLDYLYRVRESWRGERKAGDVLIVRMPPLVSKSRSPLITPEPGTEVLLLASRPGYITSKLIEGFPPSTDLRVVAMTLPLMRVIDGKLVEAASGAEVMGAASFVGTTLDDARALARQVDAQIRTIASPPPTSLRRYYIRRIGSRELPDPTRLWIEYDDSLNMGNPRGYGAVRAYFDGCSTVIRQVPMLLRNGPAVTRSAPVTRQAEPLPFAAPWKKQFAGSRRTGSRMLCAY
jgi:hypothetical protein